MKKTLKIIGVTLLTLLYIALGIYAAVTAAENKPSDKDNASGLFIASYIICIIQSIIYILSGISVPCIMLGNESTENGKEGLPFMISVYWLVVYFNYEVSPDYDVYAEVQMIVFFTILGLLGLSCIGGCIYCCYGRDNVELSDLEKQHIKENGTENTENYIERNYNHTYNNNTNANNTKQPRIEEL